ncbi:protein HGH1-like protein [Raphanus sativus]|nr:protein HGH1-like protein [Raphanus sativus]
MGFQVAGTICNCSFEAKNHLENILLISEFLWPALLLPVAGSKIYSEEDISEMPPELGSALAIEREPVTDADIRVQTLEAIYLIILQEAGRRTSLFVLCLLPLDFHSTAARALKSVLQGIFHSYEG